MRSRAALALMMVAFGLTLSVAQSPPAPRTFDVVSSGAYQTVVPAATA